MANIALLVPRQEMLDLAKQMEAETGTALYHMEVITTQNAAERAREAVANGVDIIIARGHQAFLIKQSVTIPVVEIVMTAQEMGLLVLQAKKLLRLPHPIIGIIGYINMFCDMSYFEQMYDIKLNCYLIERDSPSAEAIEEAVQSAISDSVDIVIGGDISTACARRAGINSFFLTPMADSIREAFRVAQGVAYASDLEKKNTAELKTLLDNSFCILVRLDTKGKILILNHVAEVLLGWDPQKIIGRPISDVTDAFDESMLSTVLEQGQEIYSTFIQINKVSFVANFAPIKDRDIIVGAILSCQEVTRVEEMGATAQRELQKFGNTAPFRFGLFDQSSKPFHKTISSAKVYAQSDAPLLINGGAGCEQELLAQSIHNESVRKSGPFVSFNCGALTGVEQIHGLFGSVDNSHPELSVKGAAALAHGGTLFLSNVACLEPICQVRLLHLITKGSLICDYNSRPLSVNVRVIAESESDLALRVERGEFDKTLYYALNMLSLDVPALRDRPEDIRLLAEKYIISACERYNRYITLTNGAKKRLEEYSWDGNLLQFRSFCENMVLVAPRRSVDENFIEHLYYQMYPKVTSGKVQKKAPVNKNPEATQITELLEKHHGSRSAVAAEIGISTTTLWRKIKKYDIIHKFEA